MNNGVKIAAAVVTYNPEIERLFVNLETVAPQVDKILIVDNASVNIKEFDHLAHVDYIKNHVNNGIAWALNRAFEWAHENGFEWLLTLDQDSVVEQELVAKLLNYSSASGKHVGIVFPKIDDRDGEMVIATENCFVHKLRSLKRRIASLLPRLAITSGSLVSIQAVRECGGVDEDYFIENVDWELDLKMLRRKYVLLPCESAVLDQRCGSPRLAKRGNIYLTGHSAWRFYYMYRNRVWLHRYFFTLPSFFILDDFIYLIKIPLYWFSGERKIVRAMLLGLRDGLMKRKLSQDKILEICS